jgi:hypothetical protein
MPVRTSRLACLGLTALLLLVAACSDDDPTGPETPLPDGAVAIGPAGGEVTYGHGVFSTVPVAYLHVPAGALTGEAVFAVAETADVPPPPPGAVQYGPGFRFTPDDQAFLSPVSVAIDLDYDLVDDPDGLYGHAARLRRLGSDGTWQTVDGASNYFPLVVTAEVTELGVYAVHVDTAAAVGAEPRLFVEVRSAFRPRQFDGGLLGWMTHAQVEITDATGEHDLTDTGGPVTLGDVTFDFNGTYHDHGAYNLDFLPGQAYPLVVPGSDVVPPVNIGLTIDVPALQLTHPAVIGTEVSREEGFLVTWEGTGPGLVWLAVYGTGGDGFVFHGRMTPNDGVHQVTVAEMVEWAPGTEIHVFLQSQRLLPLEADGYGPQCLFDCEMTSYCTAVVQ